MRCNYITWMTYHRSSLMHLNGKQNQPTYKQNNKMKYNKTKAHTHTHTQQAQH